MFLLVEKRFNCLVFFHVVHRTEWFLVSDCHARRNGRCPVLGNETFGILLEKEKKKTASSNNSYEFDATLLSRRQPSSTDMSTFLSYFLFSLTVWLIVFLFISQEIGVDFIVTLYQNGLCWLRLCKDRFGPVYSQGHGPLFRSPMKSTKNGSKWRRPVVVQDDWYFRLFKYL